MTTLETTANEYNMTIAKSRTFRHINVVDKCTGMPVLAYAAAELGALTPEQLQSDIEEAIANFEPAKSPESGRVRALNGRWKPLQ